MRQLSWPLAALALHEELRRQGANSPKSTAICHGIESLACKLEFFAHPESPSDRILGSRAFRRDKTEAVWNFSQLSQPHYVRNTHRQAATRALRSAGGLGFAAGTRFDLLELEPVGRALADAFLEQRVGRGGGSLRRWLTDWLQGGQDPHRQPDSLLKALSPTYSTPEEKDLVRSRLLGTSSEACEKRKKLAHVLNSAEFPDIEKFVVPNLKSEGHGQQADEIVAARAFGAILDRARDATIALTQAVEPERGGALITQLTRCASLRKALGRLRVAAESFRSKAGAAKIHESTSEAFGDALTAAHNDAEAISLLVGRVGELLALADGSVIRGALFRVVDASESLEEFEEGVTTIEPDYTGRTFRIANFHTLLRDVAQRGGK
ncbi:MAG: hypothetical protein HYW07_06340 [Candidatus Latescibacteria bacterium]|nr:hypothetical protein [Candidatus Latescibacterota bacterium]